MELELQKLAFICNFPPKIQQRFSSKKKKEFDEGVFLARRRSWVLARSPHSCHPFQRESEGCHMDLGLQSALGLSI